MERTLASAVIFLCSLSVGYAGVGVVTPEIESRALSLWERYCGGGRSEGGNDGAVNVFCKIAQEDVTENLQHNVELPQGPEGGEQVVFVQPPSYHYKHDVVVSGGGGSAGKLVIYVKPSKNTHEVNVQDQTAPASGPQKPQLFFLKGSHGADAAAPAAAAGARRRRENVPEDLGAVGIPVLSSSAEDAGVVPIPEVVVEEPLPLQKKKKVYILRRLH